MFTHYDDWCTPSHRFPMVVTYANEYFVALSRQSGLVPSTATFFLLYPEHVPVVHCAGLEMCFSVIEYTFIYFSSTSTHNSQYRQPTMRLACSAPSLRGCCVCLSSQSAISPSAVSFLSARKPRQELPKPAEEKTRLPYLPRAFFLSNFINLPSLRCLKFCCMSRARSLHVHLKVNELIHFIGLQLLHLCPGRFHDLTSLPQHAAPQRPLDGISSDTSPLFSHGTVTENTDPRLNVESEH